MNRIILLAISSLLLLSSPEYDKWSRKCQQPVKETTIKDYSQLINEMEEGLAALKKERKDLTRAEEKNSFISVWALWEAGKQLERIHPPRAERDDSDLTLYLATSDTICPQQFQEWLDRAGELDNEINNKITVTF